MAAQPCLTTRPLPAVTDAGEDAALAVIIHAHNQLFALRVRNAAGKVKSTTRSFCEFRCHGAVLPAKGIKRATTTSIR
jgi:hypothetical protein